MQLVIVDSTQIQKYIFNSNRLRENIGASHLVACATRDWALALLPTPHNIISYNQTEVVYDETEIERGQLKAELLYAGGGNLVILFQDDTFSSAFVRALSRKVLCTAPNLQLLIESRPFDWQTSLAKAIVSGFKGLAQQKQVRRLHTQPLLGLGVSAPCLSTGMPAYGLTPKIKDDEDSQKLASAEILAKHAAINDAKDRMRLYLPTPDGYDYGLDVDDLGRTMGEHSYMAVVHADGDGIGKRFQAVREEYDHPSQNRQYIQAVRQLSVDVEHIAHKSFEGVLKKIMQRLKNEPDAIRQEIDGKYSIDVVLKKKEGKWILPFRPIVFGGDDITFICDGRLAISLATLFLQAFEQASQDILGTPVTACAGIAIVKTHHPFARAYMLADSLCSSAKTYRARNELAAPCFDWHMGISGNLELIREREYKTSEGTLTLRPVTLRNNTKAQQHAWPVVKRGVKAFQSKRWFSKRNKVKALRETLREGGEAVVQFRTKYHQTLPDLSVGDYQTTGWWSKTCGYFDAIEMMDWFIDLEPEEETA